MTFRAEDFYLEAVYRPTGLLLAMNMEENPIINNVRDTTKIKDLSPNGLHGTINGATDVVGKFGRARSFAGAEDITIPHSTKFEGLTKFTVAAWASPDDVTDGGCVWDSGGRQEALDEGFNLHRTTGAGAKWRGQFFSPAGTARIVDSLTSVVSGYTRVVITYDGAVFRIYLNGVEDNTFIFAGTPVLSTTRDHVIGQLSDNVRHWVGPLDEIFVLDRDWTPAEVAADFENGSPFIVPKSKISSWSLEEVDEDLLDLCDFIVDNDGGEFNDYFKIGTEVKTYLRTEIDTETKWIWTGIVKKPVMDHSRAGGAILPVSLGDYVYEILRQRQVFESFLTVDSAQILKDAIEAKAPEIDTSQIVLGAKTARLISRGLYLKDLGFRLARHAGYQLGGDYLKRILFFPVGTDDSGILINDQKVDNVHVGPDDAALANVVRIQGGEGTGLITEQTTQTTLFTVTDAIRKQVKIRTPKRKVKEVEIYTDPTGFAGPLRVRIQADDGTGTAPVAVGDATRDLSQKELASTFLAVAGFTTFDMPQHILGAGIEYWIIVESSSVGQRVGTDSGGNLTFRAHFAYPIIEQMEEPLSIDSELGRREIDITDPTIDTKEEATDRARIEIAKRAFAERVLSLDSRHTDLLSIRPGQGAVVLLPDEGITNEKFILHRRVWELEEDAILRVDLELVEEERLVEAADVIKMILERLGKVERVQVQITGEDIVDIYRSIADEYGYADAATLTVDTVSGMIWGTDSWGLEVWSR